MHVTVIPRRTTGQRQGLRPDNGMYGLEPLEPRVLLDGSLDPIAVTSHGGYGLRAYDDIIAEGGTVDFARSGDFAILVHRGDGAPLWHLDVTGPEDHHLGTYETGSGPLIVGLTPMAEADVPTLSIDDVSLTEGDSGQSSSGFTVSLSQPSALAVTVDYGTTDDTATTGSDYAVTSGMLAIPAGQTSGVIRVPVYGDTEVESEEAFSVHLTDARGATIADHQALGTILNDDHPSLIVSPSSVSVPEGGSAQFAVQLSARPLADLTAGIAWASGDSDLSASPAALTFTPDDWSRPQDVTVSAAQDADAANDTATFTVSLAGLVSQMVTATEVDDDQPGKSQRFDFGTSISPVQSGYERVTDATGYGRHGEVTYGWVSGVRYSYDRGLGTYLTRDFVYTRDATFEVAVPHGTYDVTVTLGDLGVYAHDRMGVYLEGTHVETASASAHGVVTRAYQVTVSDGRLTLRLRDLGGSDPNVVIEALEILPSGAPLPALSISDGSLTEGDGGQRDLEFTLSLSEPSDQTVTVEYQTSDGTATGSSDYTARSGQVSIPAGASSATISVPVLGDGTHEPDETFFVNLSNASNARIADRQGEARILNDDPLRDAWRFDLGTARSPVELGCERVTDATAYGQHGEVTYGWVSGSRYSYDRGIGTDLTRDFVYTGDATFEVAVPDGTYDVTVTAGDLGVYAHDRMGFYLEETHVDTLSTAAHQVVTRAYQATVSDGRLTLRLRDLGGSDPNVVIEALEIAPSGPPPFEAKYDFGTSVSPVEAGYTRVTDKTAYSGVLGYGWQGGTRHSYDRGVGTYLTRDFVYTRDATFQVAVPDGTYDVTVTLGDLGVYAHDWMGVYLEGTHVDTVSTLAHQVATRAYQVTVSDGLLTLGLEDLGGSDPNVVIEALEVIAVG